MNENETHLDDFCTLQHKTHFTQNSYTNKNGDTNKNGANA